MKSHAGYPPATVFLHQVVAQLQSTKIAVSMTNVIKNSKNLAALIILLLNIYEKKSKSESGIVQRSNCLSSTRYCMEY